MGEVVPYCGNLGGGGGDNEVDLQGNFQMSFAVYLGFPFTHQGYFDTMRMELADKNISILSVCPGPIDTPFMRSVFTEKLSAAVDPGVPARAGGDRVSVERCVELIATTMANKLEEVWISNHPILLFVYLNQFLPNLAKWSVRLVVVQLAIDVFWFRLGKRIGNKRLHAIKSGQSVSR